MFEKRKNPHRLEPGAAVFPPTYIGSLSKLTLMIINDDPTQFRYEWRKYSLTSEEKQAMAKCDILDPSERNRVGTLLLFESENFTIFPGSAEVWPTRSQQILITFSPKHPQCIRETAQLICP
jgi:hypothetical protein